MQTHNNQMVYMPPDFWHVTWTTRDVPTEIWHNNSIARYWRLSCTDYKECGIDLLIIQQSITSSNWKLVLLKTRAMLMPLFQKRRHWRYFSSSHASPLSGSSPPNSTSACPPRGASSPPCRSLVSGPSWSQDLLVASPRAATPSLDMFP